NREGRFQGHADPPLNEAGREQARGLAAELETSPPDAVYASDLRRAGETAEVVAGRVGLPVRVAAALREGGVGGWAGRARAGAATGERFPEGAARHSPRGHGWEHGESYEQMAERVVAALLQIAEHHEGERVLVVVHGGTMRAVAARLDDVPVAEHRRRAAPVR